MQTAPVRIDGAALFSVRGIAAHSARERAAAIAGRIMAVADDTTVKVEAIVAVEAEQSTELRAGNKLIMFVFDDDADREGGSRQLLARAYVAKIRTAIEDYRRGLVPLVVPITLIRHHVRRFGAEYLAGQVYLEPHPKELMLRNHV